MSNSRLIHKLNAVCIICIGIISMGIIDSARSFQPAKTRRPISSSVLSLVPVINAAALINGPAHAAFLEQLTREALTTSTSAPSYSPPPPMRQRQTKSKQQTRKGPVTTVETIQELLAIMNCDKEAQKESDLTLVLFHAHYCKICQRATMQLTKVAREYPNVNFAKVEAKVIPEPTADNLRSLGVSKFPVVQIYRRGDCVASFWNMRKVRRMLDLCLERDEERWNEFSTEFATEIQGNRDARSQLGPELLP